MKLTNNNKIFKDKLAKLMASENLTVEYGEFETAVFDTVNRVLSLPNWSHTSNDVHDLLVGHEVSHALNTPQLDDESVFINIDEDRPQVVHTYMNVIEDARIEREIKSKFPGLKRSFYNGYKTLVEEDKFGVENRDISEMNLIDRINLYFKVGNHVRIPFSSEEKPFVGLVENTKSFDDVMEVTEKIYSYAKSKALEEMKEAETSTEHRLVRAQTDGDDDKQFSNPSTDINNDTEKVESPEDDGTDKPGDVDQSNEENSTDSENSQSSAGGQTGADELTDKLNSETSDNLKDSLDDLVEEDKWGKSSSPNYYYIPEINSDDFVVDLKEVHGQIEAYYNNEYEANLIRTEFTKFKRDTSKVVNYMAKEFELKKNAEQMSRASISKTGVVDVNKLHSYKYNDDLFRRVTSIPGGKNHGLIMFVDWSGSMSDSIGAVIRQSLTLAMFCKKVDIPFHLYSFIDAGMKIGYITPGIEEPNEIEGNSVSYGHPSIKYDSGDMTISNFRLRELLNSKLNNRSFDTAMFNLFTMATNLDDTYWRNVPYNDSLNSTPLNEAIIIAHDLIPKFRNHYQLEKVTAVWLTDGDSNNNDSRYYPDDEMEHRLSSYSNSVRVVSNKTTKNQYTANNRSEMTNALLESLKDTCEIETVGFFLTERVNHNIRWKVPTNHTNDKKLKSFYKNKSAVFNDVRGYSEYYVLRSGKKELDTTENDTLDIERGMKKGRITTAFKKHTKARLTNRVVLNSLVDLIS